MADDDDKGGTMNAASTEHTPGPWKVSGYHRAILQDKRSRDGCCLEIAKLSAAHGPGRPNGYCPANARLLAAAPELLEALRLCESELAEKLKALGELGPSRALGQARAAIAKASAGRGGTQER